MARLRKKQSGFTLIEMMIVISIMLILVSMAIPAYKTSILRAKESVLKQNLFTLRSLISQYTLDKQKAPQALEDLVSAGYIKNIPNDPMTGAPNWEAVQEENTEFSPDQTDTGIVDVKSASSDISSDGTAYNTW
jgi:general secretion pathway protein G